MVGLKIYITYFFYLITVQEDSITKNRMDRAAFFHLFINLLFIFIRKRWDMCITFEQITEIFMLILANWTHNLH